MKAVVLGHSLVSHLSRHVNSTGALKNFGLKQDEVFCRGISGALVPTIRRALPSLLRNIQPNVVCLQIGGNDLSHPAASAISVVDNILLLVHYLLQNTSITHVNICQLLPRARTRKHKGDVTVQLYNERVAEANALLSNRVHSNVSVTFWSHHRDMWNPLELYGPDGVHFAKIKPFYRSIRGCVLHLFRCCSQSIK